MLSVLCTLNSRSPILRWIYLSRSFYRSDGPGSFGKFGWDPTVTDSSSFFFCKLLLCAFSSRLFLLSFYFQIPTGFYPSYPTVSTVAINDNNHHCILSTEFANNLPLWHWWQHLHSTQLSSAFDQSDSSLHLINQVRICSEHFELAFFLPLWHQCQRRNILPLILLQNLLPLSSINI